MGQEEALSQSLERFRQAQAGLLKELGVSGGVDLAEKNPPSSVEELNIEAYRIEAISREAERYMSAQQENSVAKGIEFDQSKFEEAIRSLPDTPNGVAMAAYDLEQKNPEIKRLMEAIEDSYSEKGLIFDDNARAEAIESIPDTANAIAKKAYDIEHSLSSETLANREKMIREEEARKYEQDFQRANGGKSLKDSMPRDGEDVVADGGIKSAIDLCESFACADAHVGEVSLETLKITTQIMSTPTANESVYAVPKIA